MEPYTEYILKVRACNDGLQVVWDDEKEYCGDSEIASGRTMKDEQADRISDLKTEVLPKDEAIAPVSCRFRDAPENGSRRVASTHFP